MGSEKANDNLTAAYIDHNAVLRVEGRGSFKTSPAMKQFIHQIINTRSADRILVDMSDCTGMDSTFMGVIAGLSCYIKSKPGFQLQLVNLSEKNKKLLITLGVDRVVDYSMSASDEDEKLISGEAEKARPLESDISDKLETARTTLEAHEMLVEINPENMGKFKSVLEFLKEDVRSLSGK